MPAFVGTPGVKLNEGVLWTVAELWDSEGRGWQILTRQAECAPSVVKVKTRMWEEFGEATEQDFWSTFRQFWQTNSRMIKIKDPILMGSHSFASPARSIPGYWSCCVVLRCVEVYTTDLHLFCELGEGILSAYLGASWKGCFGSTG